MTLQNLNVAAPWPPLASLPTTYTAPPATPELVRLFHHGTATERAHAFSALYNRYCQPIWEYIYAQVDRADAEAKDIFGQVWLVALEELAHFEYRGTVMAEDPLRSWLFRCAANRIKQYYREKNAKVPLDVVEGFVWARLGGEDTTLFELFAPTVQTQANQLVYKATRNLNPDERVILRLRYHGNMSFAEIGEYLGKREGAVKVQHHRLLKKLRTLLEAAEAADEASANP